MINIKQNISYATIIRTAVLGFALINEILTITGYNPLPFSEEEVYTTLSGGLTVVVSLVTWWKNNSFTDEAIEADLFLKQLKDQK